MVRRHVARCAPAPRDGVTGVPAQEQGISNRPGDRDLEGDAHDVAERSEGRLADEDSAVEPDGSAEDAPSSQRAAGPEKI